MSFKRIPGQPSLDSADFTQRSELFSEITTSPDGEQHEIRPDESLASSAHALTNLAAR